MASSLPSIRARKETTRVASMLELPLVYPSTTSHSLRSEEGKPSTNSFTSSDTDCSAKPNSPCNILLEPPQIDRSNRQPFSRKARFGGSQSSASVTRGEVLVHDVNESIMREVPNALVTYVHDGTRPEASSMVPISSSLDFDKAFRKHSPSFIFVDSFEQSANLTIEMLRNQAGRSDEAVIIVLIQQDATADFQPTVKKVPKFIDSGADDVVVIPLGASNTDFTIAASLAKARASRDQRMNLKKQIRDSMKRCERLFWESAHDFIPGFPRFQPRLPEVCDRRVGSMVFVRRLGEGTYGSVYKCVDENRNTSSAVKVIAKNKVSSTTHAMQISTEIAVLERLEHDSIITLLGVAHGVHCIYLFMELAGSTNLFHLMKANAAKGLPWSFAGGLFSQTAAGVAHCHKMQVAHCDLKPENIMVSESGCAKIVDFGLAVDLSKAVLPVGRPFGTMPFTAPEIMSSSLEWDPPAADVWSLGVIVVEMLCGIDALIDLLGWRSLGGELRNQLRMAERANELKEFFAKDETDSHGDAVMAIYGLCHDEPPPPLMELLGNMLAFMPEDRLLAERVAERIEEILIWNPCAERS